jgi:hypothetical protein
LAQGSRLTAPGVTVSTTDGNPVHPTSKEPQMTQEPKTTPPDGFAYNEPTEEIVNDSLGTVDPADTTDTDPDDDPEATGTGPKGNEA